jgi:hypothetical protein
MALAAGCGEDEEGGAFVVSSEPAVETSPSPVETVEKMPEPVAATRAAILAAAQERDFDALGELIEPAVFLSDAGFGVDPIPSWREQGELPLETMETLLSMLSTTEATNEGELYRWPRFTANSDPEEMQPKERDALVALLGEDGLINAFQEETGYVGPRLGILADGTWWFLILQSAP